MSADFERLQTSQESRLQEIRFIEEEKKRIQSQVDAISLANREQENGHSKDNKPYVSTYS